MSSTADPKTRSLAELGLTAIGGAQAAVTGLAVDSRDVKKGTLFFALPGANVHGGEFIQYALRMGAAAVVTDAQGAQIAKDELAASGAALILTEDPREVLAQTASLWFGAHPETVIAVTGTNGKTSVSTFARQIWVEMDQQAVNLGTTGVEGAWTHPLKHTTPEPITLHSALAQARAAGITHVAMEASSHGSTSAAWMGCFFRRRGSAISHKTIWIITKPSKPISTQKWASSPVFCPRMAWL